MHEKVNEQVNYLRTMWIDFKYYLRRNIPLLLFTILIVLLSSGIRLFYYFIEWDEETLLAPGGYSATLSWWIQLGRWGLSLLKYLTGTGVAVTWVSNLGALIFYAAAAFVWGFTLYRFSQKQMEKTAVGRYIFTLLFCGAPIFVEFVVCSVLNLECMLMMLLLTIGIIIVSDFILCNKAPIWLGVLILILAFGTYQSYTLFTLCGVICCLLLHAITRGKEDTIHIFTIRSFGRAALVFGGSFGVSLAIGKAALRFFALPSVDYFSSQMQWGNLPSSECLSNIKTMFQLNYGYKSSFGTSTYSYLFVLPFFVLILAYLFAKRKRYPNFGWVVLLAIGVVASPMLLAVVSASMLAMRTYIAVVLAAAFLSFLIIYLIPGKQLKMLVACVLLIFGLQKAQTSAQLYYTHYMLYQHNAAMADEINNEVQKIAGQSVVTQPAVLIGTYVAPIPSSGITNVFPSHTGFSNTFFVDSSTDVWRFVSFMNSRSYPYQKPDQAQIEYARVYAETMPVWPSEGSIQISDNIIIVHMG